MIQLLVDPHHPDTLYRVEIDLETSKPFVAVSRDGGRTWTAVPSAPPLIQELRPDPIQPRYAALLAFRENDAYGAIVIWTSEDAGATWSLATADLPLPRALAPDPTVPGRLLAGTDRGLFVSEDGGLHWSPLGDLPAGAAVRQLVWDPLSASWYAATADRGIYRGLDGGAHWTLLDGAPDHDNPAIAVDPRRPTALLAAFAGQGLWRWTP